MPTKLDRPLKREVDVNGVPFTVTLSPDGLRIVEKGRRKGQQLSWEQLVRGDVSLTQDLKDSVDLSRRDA